MVRKFDVVDFDEDRAKDLAEIMGNKTSRKILEYLRENEATETEVAKELRLAGSTVHYNIQKLVKNGLIDIKRFYWSPKGNKVNVYKASNKVLVFTQKKSQYLESKLRMVLPAVLIVLVSLILIVNIAYFSNQNPKISGSAITGFASFIQSEPISHFNSCSALVNAFSKPSDGFGISGLLSGSGKTTGAVITSSATAPSAESYQGKTEYSGTNIQVEGVDEADIVKTDGEFIYVIVKGKLIIAKAYPESKAEIVSEVDLEEFNPSEIFIDRNKLLIFGSANIRDVVYEVDGDEYTKKVSLTTVQLFDISNREDPELIKSLDFEGSYLTSRKIDDLVYFVLRSRPRYNLEEDSGEGIIPVYRERAGLETEYEKDFEKIVPCGDVEYFKPINAQNMISIISISISDPDEEINKKVIVGSGENVYVSLDNLYIAEVTRQDETNVHKFALDDGEISYTGNMEVPGIVLNQFSMDEHKGYFRIATTIGHVSKGDSGSTNNIYIFDEDLDRIGKIEGLAKGEKIYSARFMGDRGYLVTFKKVDPLFVIDLSDPDDPKVLGKLKIPGYSDYLHPYNENYLIGVGKDTIEADNGNFAWYQGVKIALFDVTDVENPIELHKVIIGDRGTDSEVLRDHKAFLFDKDKNLLVIPVNVVEANESGDFRGAYVYELTIYGGFDLRGKISHDGIRRSLYIEDILYTISERKIQLNSLIDLDKIKELVF